MEMLTTWLQRLKKPGTNSAADYYRGEALLMLEKAKTLEDWCVLSRNYNGFAREVAVRMLAQMPCTQSLLALIERVNDRVAQVRDLAQLGLEEYLQPRYQRELLEALPALVALLNKDRNDHRALVTAVENVLLAAPAHARSLEHLQTLRGRPARFLFVALARAEEVALLPTLQAGLGHQDVSVQREALKTANRLAPEQARTLYLKALEKRGSAVRLLALRGLYELYQAPQQAQALLNTALLDPSNSIRSFGRWQAQNMQVDLAEFVLQRLQQPMPETKREWLGLLYLAYEVAAPESSSLFVHALKLPSADLRVLALSGLRVTLHNSDMSYAMEALNDSSDRVFNCAASILEHRYTAEDLQALLAPMLSDARQLPDPHRVNVLLGLLPGWRQLDYLLRWHEQMQDRPEHWLELIDTWCQRRNGRLDYTTPKSERTALWAQVTNLVAQECLPKSALLAAD
jgi:hypothetical protein